MKRIAFSLSQCAGWRLWPSGSRRARALGWYISIALLSLWLSGAASPKSGPRPPIGPDYGSTLIRRLTGDVTTLNPVRAVSNNDRYVAAYLFTPLLRLDRHLRPAPGLATSWTISKDGLSYQFTLNKKATFSDGTAVRARDVVFTLRKAVDTASMAPQIASSFQLLDLARTRAINDHLVEVVFRGRLARQLLDFNRLMVIPEHVYAKGNFSDDYNEMAVGSGPYVLVQRHRGETIKLRRRNNYWDNNPYVSTIVFKVIASDTTAWNAINRGELDETRITAETWFRQREKLAKEGSIDVQRFYTFNYNFIAWNHRNPILQDKRVRRAMAMCLPLDDVITFIYYGTARRLSGPFMPGTFAYNQQVPLIPYRPQEAKRTLTTLGWIDHDHDGIVDRDGQPLSFELLIDAQNTFDRELSQLLQAELKNVGIQLRIAAVDENTLINTVLKGTYDAALVGLTLGPEPDPYGIFHSSRCAPAGQNIACYRNAAADRLIEEAQRELDRGKRGALYRRLHEIFAADQPYTWTVQVQEKWVIQRRIHGVVSTPGFGLFRWYPGELAWWIPRPLQTAAVPSGRGRLVFMRPGARLRLRTATSRLPVTDAWPTLLTYLCWVLYPLVGPVSVSTSHTTGVARADGVELAARAHAQ